MPKAYLRFVYKPWTHAYVFFLGFLLGDYIKGNLKLLKQRPKLSKVISFKSFLNLLTFNFYFLDQKVPAVGGRPLRLLLLHLQHRSVAVRPPLPPARLGTAISTQPAQLVAGHGHQRVAVRDRKWGPPRSPPLLQSV